MGASSAYHLAARSCTNEIMHSLASGLLIFELDFRSRHFSLPLVKLGIPAAWCFIFRAGDSLPCRTKITCIGLKSSASESPIEEIPDGRAYSIDTDNLRITCFANQRLYHELDIV
jgi:hypothetical protein